MNDPMIPLTGNGGYISTAQAVPFVRGNGQTTSGEVTEAPEQDAPAQDTNTPTPDREDAAGVTENI